MEARAWGQGMYGPCPNTLGRMLSCFFLTPAGSDIQDIPWLLAATPSPCLSLLSCGFLPVCLSSQERICITFPPYGFQQHWIGPHPNALIPTWPHQPTLLPSKIILTGTRVWVPTHFGDSKATHNIRLVGSLSNKSFSHTSPFPGCPSSFLQLVVTCC